MSKLQDFISNNTVHSYRFVIYAYSNGNTSEEQLSIDSVTHPRGKYEPFMLWSMAKIRAIARKPQSVHGWDIRASNALAALA